MRAGQAATSLPVVSGCSHPLAGLRVSSVAVGVFPLDRYIFPFFSLPSCIILRNHCWGSGVRLGNIASVVY